MALTKERIYQMVGIGVSQIEPYQAKIREAQNQRIEEERRALENLAYAREEKAKNQNIERQRLREAVRVKATEDTSWYRELQSSVLASKVVKYNQEAVLKKKQQEQEKATQVSEGQYAGGMLLEALVKAEQKREEQTQRNLEEVNTYNECAAQKALQRKQESTVPPCLDQEDRKAAKQLAQKARFNTLTEGVILKRRRLEQEQREEHEREEQCRLAQADLQAKYKLRAQPKQERFQQQQLLKDEAVRRLQQLKKEQEVRTWREEEKEEARLLADHQLLLQQEQKARSRKDAAERDTIAYWGKQVQEREDQRKQEQTTQSTLCYQKEQCERERHLQETERQKAQQKRQQEQCTQFNRSMIAQRSVLELRQRKQEREEQERETQRLRQEHSRYQDYVEREIQAAKVDQRVTPDLMALRHRNELSDPLHIYKNVLLRKKRSFQESKYTDVKDEALSDNGKCHSTPESQKIKEKIECQNKHTNTNVSPYSTNCCSVARPAAPNCAPKKLLEPRATRTPSPMAANKTVLTSSKKGAQRKYPRLPEIVSKRSECVKLPPIRTSRVKARCQDLSEMIEVIPLRPFVRE